MERVPVETQTVAESGETNAYVVGSGSALLVDPAARTDTLDSVVATNPVDHVAVTHHHPDHVGSVAAYAREFDLTIWARTGRADAFERATGARPDRLFSPGEILPAGDGITVVDTPGHAPEHVAFATPAGTLCGDLVVADESVVVAPPDGDMRAYLTSLRRLYGRKPPRLYPGHGPVIDDPRAVCRRLLEHRLDREETVLAAVRAGHSAPADIVETVYDKDVSAVFELARGTVIAHLKKLAVEGKISWDGIRAEPA